MARCGFLFLEKGKQKVWSKDFTAISARWYFDDAHSRFACMIVFDTTVCRNGQRNGMGQNCKDPWALKELLTLSKIIVIK